MAGTARTVAALAGGYLLGRTKKMRLALMLTAMVAGKKMAGGGGEGLTSRLDNVVPTNPGVSSLTEQIQDSLTQAVPAGVVTPTTQKVGRLSDNLDSRAKALRGGEGEKSQGKTTQDQQDGEEGAGTKLLRGLRSGSGAEPGSEEREPRDQAQG